MSKQRVGCDTVRQNAAHHGDNLTPGMVRAAQALALGDTDVDAAQAAGVSRSTLYRWYKRADFVACRNFYRVRAAQTYELEREARVRELARLALDALRDGLDPEQPVETRIKVAAMVLSRLNLNLPVPDVACDPKALADGWRRSAMSSTLQLMTEQTLHVAPLSDEEASFGATIAELETNPPALPKPHAKSLDLAVE